MYHLKKTSELKDDFYKEHLPWSMTSKFRKQEYINPQNYKIKLELDLKLIFLYTSFSRINNYTKLYILNEPINRIPE